MSNTKMFMFGILLTMALWDVYVIARNTIAGEEKDELVSQFITNCSAKPRLAFVCGVIVCHFFGWMMFPK